MLARAGTGWEAEDSMVTSGSRVLVTGGAGYIGSWVVQDLLKVGYQVTVIDRLMFGRDGLDGVATNPQLRIVVGDCRDEDLLREEMQHASAVVHLAGLVGDPACAVDEGVSKSINVDSTLLAARLAREADARFVFASSCSVYGVSSEISDEQAKRAPVSIYARNKCEAEDLLAEITTDRFAPVILRFATIHGLSPRPRFDLVVNLFSALATRNGAITVFGGDQWRPFVHCADVAEALVTAVEAPDNLVCGEIFNVGSDPENYRIKDLATLVSQEIPGTQVSYSEQVDDERDYRVSFDKIRQRLGFVPERTVSQSIREIHTALAEAPSWDIHDSRFSNVKRVREQLDDLRAVLGRTQAL